MPRNFAWQTRIKGVEREYVAMRQAAERFLTVSLDDPTILLRDLRRSEVVTASRNLEGTYLMRLFAEFESGLRAYWNSTRKSVPTTGVLINRLGSRHKIPDSLRDQNHEVRDYRNSLVHSRDESTETVPISTARSYLCKFFSYLPEEW